MYKIKLTSCNWIVCVWKATSLTMLLRLLGEEESYPYANTMASYFFACKYDFVRHISLYVSMTIHHISLYNMIYKDMHTLYDIQKYACKDMHTLKQMLHAWDIYSIHKRTLNITVVGHNVYIRMLHRSLNNLDQVLSNMSQEQASLMISKVCSTIFIRMTSSSIL